MSKDSKKSFHYLIATQFQGAFTDNAYKNLIGLLALTTAVTEIQGNNRLSLSSALFVVPFLLFSMYGGFLADKYSKRTVILGTKLAEVAIMILATIGLYTGNLIFSMTILFLTGTQAAIFGPSKYSVLPELLKEKDLSWGNGVLEMTTFIAIILGTVAGAFFIGNFKEQLFLAGIILTILSLIGTYTSWKIEHLLPANPSACFKINFIAETLHYFKEARRDRILFLAVIGGMYFWFLGFLLLTNVLTYGNNILHLPEKNIGLLNAALSLGIGLGSYVAGYLSGHKIEYGLIPLGGFGVSCFSLILAFPGWNFWQSSFLLSLLGFSAGFFIVPIFALQQQRPDPKIKGGIIAMSNLMTFVGMLIAAGLFWILSTQLATSPLHIFLVGSLITLGATIYTLILVPDSLMRFLLWLLTHTFYRVRVIGRDNIPEKGGALFVSNHISLVDALLIIASTDRFIYFMMEKEIYDLPFIKPFAKMLRVIPISSRQGARDLIRALREASKKVQEGEVVCIFAEGQMTRTGQLLPFRKGFERIMKNVDAPIVPICLDGVWGSIFSYKKGRLFWKIPSHPFHPVTVTYGSPLPGNCKAEIVRQKVQELATEAFTLRKTHKIQLQQAFLREVSKHPWRFAAADGMNPKISYLGLLFRSVFLTRLMKPKWKDEKMIGLFIPPSVAGAAANIAVQLAGKIPVNLNYTVSQTVLESCINQCQLQIIIASRQLAEKVKLSLPANTIYLEDLVEYKTKGRLLAALLHSIFVPSCLLQQSLGASNLGNYDSLATIIFSSGSTGDPKGIMLSHHNICSNIEGMGQVFSINKHDRFLGILPFFHSFGFTATLWFPLTMGIGVVYHPNPLEARHISTLTGRYKATILLATPTFLQSYIRRCTPEDFGSIQFAVVGAEKLSDRIANAFEEKFGIRPMEGYGCTECSPIVSVNIKDFRAAGFYQVGQKRGRIGHPLPGVSVRIVDPETMQPLPTGSSGLLLVKGSNVMLGYLNQPEKTSQVFYDGWYITGDLASLDADGFITISDRISRFSKIGGEMVPHLKVEETLHQLAETTELTFAVTGIPDEKKGERLVVLYTLAEEKLKNLLPLLNNAGLPNLWIPRSDSYFKVEKIPVLGTGKLDLRTIRTLAQQLSVK